MGATTLAYGATSTSAARMRMTLLAERFGVSPILAAQAASAPAAAKPAAAHAAHTTKNVVDRKADDWVLPRGRRL